MIICGEVLPRPYDIVFVETIHELSLLPEPRSGSRRVTTGKNLRGVIPAE